MAITTEPPNRAWQRALTTLAALGITISIIAALYWARSVFIPVTLAVFFAFVLSPLVHWLRRLGLGKAPTVLAAVIFASSIVIGTMGIVTWQFSELTARLPEKTETIKGKIAAVKAQIDSDGENRLVKMFEEISNSLSPPTPPKALELGNPFEVPSTVTVQPTQKSWMNSATDYLSPATEALGQAAFALVLTVFILWKRDDLRNRLIRLIGDSRLTTATKAVDDASRRISRYLLMQVLINSTFGLLIASMMFVIGVPFALLWGVVAAMMRYIPYLGTWLGLIPALIVTVAFTDYWWQPAMVFVVYVALELACNNYFEPKLYGSSMGISEVALLVSAAFWAFLWGPVGLILSGPLTVCLLVLGKYVSGLHFFEILLGDEEVLTPDVRFFQRLTARDQDEAWEIVRDEAKTRPAIDVVDTIAIPALTYTKRDTERGDLTEVDLAAMLLMAREISDDLLDPGTQEKIAEEVEPTSAEEKVRVLVIPAKDSTDEVACTMLHKLLDERKWEVTVSPVSQLTSEIVDQIAEINPAVIIICTLPPGGLTHTRYVCKRVARQFPESRIVVCRSHTGMYADDSTAELLSAGAAHVTASMAETVRYLHAWLAAFDNQQKHEEKAINKDYRATGMTSAIFINV